MLLNNVTPQLPVSMPSSATPNYSRPHTQLRVFTGARSPLYHPTPRLHSQLETVRTAPLLLNPPPPRRAVSENVNALLTSFDASTPTLPPRTRPGLGHKRKISEKLRSIFQNHTRQTSEPLLEPPLPLASAPFNHPPRTSSMHHRFDSTPDTRVAKWVKQQTTEATKSPPRPRRSPDTASFVVSSHAAEFTFPRYHSHPHAESTPALHADTKEMFNPLDEDTLMEPITAALYPHGKGLLGATQQRARFGNDSEGEAPSMFRFDDPRPPAYSFERESKCEADASEASDDHFSDFAQWYVAPK